jgi:hypothetical protein
MTPLKATDRFTSLTVIWMMKIVCNTWEELSQEADWITDPGTTQARETLYHKTINMAWRTNMLIGKVSVKKKVVIQKGNKDQKKLLKEILSRLNNLDASTK